MLERLCAAARGVPQHVGEHRRSGPAALRKNRHRRDLATRFAAYPLHRRLDIGPASERYRSSRDVECNVADGLRIGRHDARPAPPAGSPGPLIPGGIEHTAARQVSMVGTPTEVQSAWSRGRPGHEGNRAENRSAAAPPWPQAPAVRRIKERWPCGPGRHDRPRQRRCRQVHPTGKRRAGSRASRHGRNCPTAAHHA